MTKFQSPFFTSASDEVQAEYAAGVRALQEGDCSAASRCFGNAARGGHVSALFNLSLLWGGGNVTPYDFDLAADCWYKAAEAGHPRAKAALWQLEAADRGGFGADNLAKFAAEANSSGNLVPSIMICAARFYDVLCRKYGAVADVIAYELDAAETSDFDFVHSFIKRTGVKKDFYKGGLDGLKAGSAADQITDGLNKLHVALRRSGVSDELAVMARCSIVGHIIAKSPYGKRSEPLRGVDTFFSDADRYSREVEERMFGFSRKGPSSKFHVMDHDVEVVSVSRDGNVLFTGEAAKGFPKSHLEGQIFEVSFETRSGNPYFVYYLCPDYYFAVVGPAGAASFGGPFKTEEFRSVVSQHIAAFLVQYLQHAFRLDARTDITSFSHNRAHTNVLAYVASLNNWYAIQHNDSEGDDASERKVALVNRGGAQIADVIAIDAPSPSAA